MLTLEDAWGRWAAAAIPPGALISQRMALRTAFYSGAATLLAILMEAPDDAEEQTAARLHAELHQFVQGLQAMEQRKSSRLV
jgi:hypothetical protein